MAKKKTEETEQTKDASAAVLAKLKNIKKKYGDWTAGILSDAQWPDVKEWISTGSSWLDSIIKEGVGKGGFPVGRVSLLAGLAGCLTEDTEIEVVLLDLCDKKDQDNPDKKNT